MESGPWMSTRYAFCLLCVWKQCLTKLPKLALNSCTWCSTALAFLISGILGLSLRGQAEGFFWWWWWGEEHTHASLQRSDKGAGSPRTGVTGICKSPFPQCVPGTKLVSVLLMGHRSSPCITFLYNYLKAHCSWIRSSLKLSEGNNRVVIISISYMVWSSKSGTEMFSSKHQVRLWTVAGPVQWEAFSWDEMNSGPGCYSLKPKVWAGPFALWLFLQH